MKKLKKFGIIFASIILVIAAGLFVFANYKSVLARGKISGIEQYASSVEELKIPDNIKVIGLGEATHGNVEFQTLKQELFEKLVEENGVRAFALEIDFGSTIPVNEYILGGEGTATDAIRQFDHPIYCTKQITDLLDWMRTYNETAPEEEKLHFYGVDMQACEPALDNLKTFCEEYKIDGVENDFQALEELKNVTDDISENEAENYEKNLASISNALENAKDNFDTTDKQFLYEMACYAITTTRQFMTYMGTDIPEGAASYREYRDICMAENTEWISENEEKHANGKVFINAHNGHIQKAKDVEENTTLGYELAERFGDNFYVIGTDFFTAKTNISTSSMVDGNRTRKNHHFCSADPLAYQAKYQKDQRYFLDFSKVTDTESAVYEKLHSETMMANIGEGFIPVLWYLMDSSYRGKAVPSDLYDGMIFVYKATPIEVLGE